MGIRPFLPTGGKLSPMHLLIFIHLLEGPKYGYEILVSLRNDFEGSWIPKTGTVYPALKTLVRKGFINESEIDGTIYYSLTKTGRAVVNDTKDLVREYVLFNYQFMTTAAKRLPVEFIQSILLNFYELGLDDIIPEEYIIEAISKASDSDLKIQLLKYRKRTLLDKVKKINHALKSMEVDS